MSDIFGQIRDYLPKFLSPAAQAELFRELDAFPDNIDGRMYSRAATAAREIYQGDGVRDLFVVNLPSSEVRKATCLVLSNTCDVSPENERYLPTRLCYCPIIKLSKLHAAVSAVRKNGVDDVIRSIRGQRMTSMFYLPKGGGLDEEGIALLDHALNCEVNADRYAEFVDSKIYSLSNYGFYLFLFKLSIHFTRIADGVNREMDTKGPPTGIDPERQSIQHQFLSLLKRRT